MVIRFAYGENNCKILLPLVAFYSFQGVVLHYNFFNFDNFEHEPIFFFFKKKKV
jgi:hypothetical protein